MADLVSETFLAALQASGRYRPESETALPWVFGIARRVLARQRRTKAGANRVMQKVANVSPHYQGAEDDAIAAAVDAARHAPHIEAALDTLSRGERDVLELVAYQGLTPREAAIALDLTANAARLKLSRARKRMRQHLSDTPGLERLEPGTRHAF